MKKNLKKYIVNADESDLFAVSIVDAPAVESEFIALSKQEPLYFRDDAKHMVYGCALRTDFPIYRNSDEYGEYYLEFSKDAVEKMMRRFFKAGYQNNFTQQHSKNIDGMTITESWIKTDPYKDKSMALGIGEDCAVGSWFIGAYVDSNDTWEKIKNGEYKGFSVEALCSLDEFNLQKQDIEMDADNETFWTKMKNLMRTLQTNPNGEEIFDKNEQPSNDNNEQPSNETQINATGGDENSPVDNDTTEAEITQQVETVETVETNEDIEPNNETVETVEDDNPRFHNDDISHLNNLVKNLQEELKALAEANQELQDKVKELGKKPSAKPVNTKSNPNPKDTYKAWREQMRNYLG